MNEQHDNDFESKRPPRVFDAQQTERPSSKRRKGIAIAGVVTAVIVLAAAGGLVWHEQPSFCGTICHDPMNYYVEGYYSENEACLASVHEQQQITCLECHEATIDDQINEATAWISGDFETAENGQIVDDSIHIATTDFCLASGCHEQNEIVEATEDYGGNVGYNPHQSHNGTLECGSCHSMHGESTLYCSSCHDMGTPDGWAEAPDLRDVGFSFEQE